MRHNKYYKITEKMTIIDSIFFDYEYKDDENLMKCTGVNWYTGLLCRILEIYFISTID